jgi:hypothetical protein
MGFLSRLFNRDKTHEANQSLMGLLQKYSGNKGVEAAFTAVINELMDGKSQLLILTKAPPSENPDGSIRLEVFSSINDFGDEIYHVFTDEASLKQVYQDGGYFVSMPSQSILQLANENGIGTIVINPNLPTMFVLKKSPKTGTSNHTIKAGTPVKIGYPEEPLSESIVSKLRARFEKIKAVSEAFQYAQDADGEFSLVLAIKLSESTEEIRNTVIRAIQLSLENETLNTPLDLNFIDESWQIDDPSLKNLFLYRRK